MIPQIWAALLSPHTVVPTCQEERNFEDLLVRALKKEAGPLILGGDEGARKLVRDCVLHLLF
jgi:hypothetical protein